MKSLAIMVLVLLAFGNPAFASVSFNPFDKTGIDQKPDVIIPFDRSFKDESGETVTLRGLSHGLPVVLVPVLHNCPNICGVTLSGLMQAIGGQTFRPGKDFVLVIFGIDPKEGPKDASNDMAQLRLRYPSLLQTGVHALTGTAADVHSVTDALGYRYAFDEDIGQFAHVAAVAVLTQGGVLSRWLYGIAPTETDLKLALTEAGQGAIGSWTDQVLLLCYCYDPQTGQYSSNINTALQIGAGTTAAICIGGIGWAVARERWKAKKQGGLS